MEIGSERVRTVRLRPALNSREYRWMYLPYGICKWGTGEALFNRRYRIIYFRDSDGKVRPSHLVYDKPMYESAGTDTKWFYDDGTPELQKRQRALAALANWGIDPRKPDVRLRPDLNFRA